NAAMAFARADGATALGVIAAWSGDRAALDAVCGRGRSEPFNIWVLSWCGRTAARLGEVGLAADTRSWLDAVVPGSEFGALEIRVSDSATPFVAGINSLFAGHYSYRR